MSKKQVLFVQVSYSYGNNVFLPYTAGRLWASCLAVPSIREEFELVSFVSGRPKGFLFLREDPTAVVNDLAVAPAIVFLSYYLWNEEWNARFTKALQARFPSTKLVCGGPQIESEPASWSDLLTRPIRIYGEGERVIQQLLAGDFLEDKSIAFIRATQQRDLSLYPSPYLTGVFDEILQYHSCEWNAPQETHRGCPYRCSYCAWNGSLSHVVDFPLDTVLAELEWFARNRIPYIFNCDANFGLRREAADAVVDSLVALKREFGYPKKFRASYAKDDTKRLIPMCAKLAEAGLSKGITLSLQSSDHAVLEASGRRDKAVARFASDVAECARGGIPTYTEVILGLPEQTYKSFVATLDFVLESGQHDGLNIYPCVVLPGSELDSDSYRRKYGLETIRTPAILNHGVPDSIPEYYSIIRSTNAMSTSDMIRAFELGWVVQTFDTLGIFREIGVYLHGLGLRYTEIYGALLKVDYGFLKTRREFTGKIAGFYNGKTPAGLVKYGIQWPLEEAAFLCFTEETTQEQYLELCAAWLQQLGVVKLVVASDIDVAWENIVKPAEYPSLREYARQVVWYGRKGGSTLRRSVR